MAKRRTRRRLEPPKQNTQQPQSTTLTAADGFVNTLAYLNEASELSKANDYERHSITNDFEQLTILYRENWIAKKIIDTPAEDMTRSWYSVASEIGQTRLDELAKLEAKHNIKQEITNAIRWARLYGGAAAIIVIKGQEEMLDHPLDFDMLMPGCFRGLIVVDRVDSLTPSIEIEENMNDPEYGYPMYYTVCPNRDTGEIVKIHHSRLLIFRGRILPIIEEENEDFFGASELEHVYEELQKRNATSANIAQLVFQANVTALKMADYGEIIGMGTERQKRQIYDTIQYQNRIKNSFGLMLMSNEDSYEQHPYSFAGIAEVYESFMLDMAGAAEIPATKLYGRSPEGMNATGESDMKNYYEMVAGLQERILKPAIEKLLPVMAMSLWGVIPNDMEVVFEPLETTTPAERAQISQQQAGSIIQAFSAGIISQKVAMMELRETGKAINMWTSISDEDIENAEEEVDSGEGMQDPMGGMMPPGAQEGQEQAPAAPGEEEPAPQEEAPQGPQNAPNQEPDEEAQDGGPGSGPRPGYHKNGAKAGLMERARFIANPTEGMSEPKRQTPSKAHTQQMNKERKDWNNLTLHQKVQGNAEQEKHMAKMRAQVTKAALKGDLGKARQIVKENRHYWSNDPDSAQKVQTETLKRQKAVKPRHGFLHDTMVALMKLLGRDWNEQDHPRGNGGKFVSKGSGSVSGSEISESESSKPVEQTSVVKQQKTETPKLKESSETENKNSESVANGSEVRNNNNRSRYFTGERFQGHNFPKLSTTFCSEKPETFRDAVVEAQESYSDAEGWRVGPHDEYTDADKCFVSESGSTTCVAENGDIVSVCKKKGSKDRASDLLQQAIANGGDRLDAYGMGLFRLYTSNGFEPCSWCEWDDEYASDKWKAANGLPDDNSWFGIPDSELKVPREPVLFYRYTGKKAAYSSEDDIRNAYDGFLKSTESAGTDYGAAYEQRDKMMEGAKQ